MAFTVNDIHPTGHLITVTGFGPGTKESILRAFFGDARYCGLRNGNILKLEVEQDKALLLYNHREDADKILKTSKYKWATGECLYCRWATASDIEQCTPIEVVVSGFSHTHPQTVGIFLKQERFHPSEILDINMDLLPAGYVVITYKSTEAARPLLDQSADLKLEEAKLTTKLYTDQSAFSIYVELTKVAPEIHPQAIELFLGNRDLGGYGLDSYDTSGLREGRLIVKYNSFKAVKTLLRNQQLNLEGSQLNAALVATELIETGKVIVTGFRKETHKQTVQLYIENIGRHGLQGIDFADFPRGNIVVTFYRHKDAERFVREDLSLEDKQLQASIANIYTFEETKVPNRNPQGGTIIEQKHSRRNEDQQEDDEELQRTVIVEGIPCSAHKQEVEIVFDNPTLGEIEDINYEWLPKYGMVTIIYKTLSGAKNVLTQREFTVAEKNTKTYKCLAYDGYRKYHTLYSRTVQVMNYKTSTGIHMLQLYFGNKKHGGGKIERIYHDQKNETVYITYCNIADAKTISTRKHHWVGDDKLHIYLLKPAPPNRKQNPPFEKNVFVIRHLPPEGVTRELKDFFEMNDRDKCLFSTNVGIALLKFKESKDFATLQTLCREIAFNGHMLSVERLPEPTCLLTYGVGEFSYDEMKLFFDHLSGDKVVDVTHTRRSGISIIEFEDSEALRKVMEKRPIHFSDNKDTYLLIELYYESFGKIRNEETALFPWIPKDVPFVGVPTEIINFINSRNVIRDKIDKLLQESNALIIWPRRTGNNITLKYQAFKSCPSDTWETSVTQTLQNELHKFTSNSISVVHDAWEQVCKEVKSCVSAASNEKVGFAFHNTSLSISVNGFRNEVTEWTDAITRIVHKVEMHIKYQKRKRTETITVTKPHAITLLKKSDIKDKVPRSVQFEISNSSVIRLTGVPEDIKTAKVIILQIENDMHKYHKPLDENEFHFFQKPDVLGYLTQEYANRSLNVVIEIVNNQLVLHGIDQSTTRSAIAVNTDHIKVKTILIPNAEHEYVITTPEWIQKMHDFSRQSLIHIAATHKLLTIFAVKDKLAHVVDEVQGLLKKHAVTEKTLAISPSQHRLLILDPSHLDFVDDSVKLKSSATERPCFVIKGTRENIKLVEQKLQGLLGSIKQGEHDIHTPGLAEYFLSNVGRTLIDGLERQHKVHILYKNDDAGSPHAMDQDSSSEEEIPMEEYFAEQTTVNACTISVKVGELAQEKVDAIVNSAPKDLQLGNGRLSKSLLDEAGDRLQVECDTVAPNGVKPGKLVVTGGAGLKCRFVYHGCCIRWQGDGSDAQKKLEEFIDKCICEAHRNKVTSMSIPCMGTGQYYQMPYDCVASLLVGRVASFANKNNSSSLKEVNFVIHPQDTRGKEAFQHVLSNLNGNKTTITDRRRPYILSKGASVDDAKTVNHYRTPEGMDIEMKIGELAKETAEAIVSSSPKDLDLAKGPLSKSLLDAGGQTLQDECNNDYPDGMKPGDLAITSGGNLKCKYVFHGCCQKYDGQGQKAEQLLQQFLENCLREADKTKLQSLSMPLMGTGKYYNFPRDKAAEIALESVISYSKQNPNSALKHINIVIFYKDKDSKQAMEAELSKHNANGSLQSSDEEFFDILRTCENSFTTQNGMNISLELGKLAEIQADVIVNSADKSLKLDRGRVSKSLLEAAGSRLQDECNQVAPNGVKPGDLVQTSGGNLSCNYVFHGTCCKWQGDGSEAEQALSSFLTKCLATADDNGQESIAIPAMGTGDYYRMPPDRVAKLMMEDITSFSDARPRTAVRSVMLIIHPSDKKSKQAFAKEVVPYIDAESDTSNKNRFPTKTKRNRKSSKKRRRPCTQFLTLEFHSFSTQAITKVTQAIDDICERNTREENLESEEDQDYIANLSSAQVDEINDLATEFNVAITIDKGRGNIRIRGLHEGVFAAKEKIHNIFKGVADHKTAEMIYKNVAQWTYENRESFTNYELYVNAHIEKAFHDNKRKVQWSEWDSRGEREVTCTLDFKTMLETREYSRRTRHVRRFNPNDEVAIPPTWTMLDSHKPNTSVPLKASSTEFKEAVKLFNQHTSNSFTITQVERIQNQSLYQKVRIHKQHMTCKNVKSRQLFHGTSKKTIPNINANGFNRSYAGVNTGHWEGKGVYFATDASYSTKDYYSRPDEQGNKYMYLCTVLTGDYCNGTSEMIDTPQKDPNNPDVLYDSTVNDVKNPTVFVVFRDTQAYPDYLITFHP